MAPSRSRATQPPRPQALALVVLLHAASSLPLSSAFQQAPVTLPHRPQSPFFARQRQQQLTPTITSTRGRLGSETPGAARSYSSTASKTGLRLAAPSSSAPPTPPPLPDTSDPFLLLGLDPSNPTADRKEIKRAYKRRALLYHPDVVVTINSTPEEKRKASDDFAKINAAYEMLSGKGAGGAGVGGPGGGGGSGGGSTSGYRPPHRRSGAYSPPGGGTSSGSGGGASTDWRDYMPRYEEEDAKYDAGDDSFESIFTDLFAGAAAGAVGAAAGARGGGGGGGGILKDLIDFLEGNVDGFASGYEEDDSLASLLTVGSMEEVADEVDDTQLLVSQLETKLDAMEKEVAMIQEEVKLAMRYVEKIEFEERLAEIEARKGVVKNYLKKARKRLVKLQGRYKELIVEGRADSRAGTGGYYSSGGSSSSSYSSSGTDSSYRTSDYGGSAGRSSGTYPGDNAPTSGRVPSPSPSTSSSPPSSSPAGGGEDDPQSFNRREGFGSFGRRGGRGTGRGRRASRGTPDGQSSSSTSSTSTSSAGSPGRTAAEAGSTGTGARSSSTSTSTSDGQRSSYSPPPRPPPSRPSPTSSPTSSSSSIQEREEWKPPVPPHRRSGPDRQAADDKKRLREIKVDDEFEKLKKELGM